MDLGRLVNRVMNPLGLEVRRRRAGGGTADGNQVVRGPIFDPSTSHMADADLETRLAADLGDVAAAFLHEHLGAPESEALRARCASLAAEFLDLFRDRPVRDTAGGSGFHNAFWLFVLARHLDPALVVESGVWKGMGSWMLRRACPKAAVHAFDVSLRQLAVNDPTIRFHETDWSGFDFGPVDAGSSLCFFDCHVNHARRVQEAYAKGFRRLLFDDNPPAHKLYGYGRPGVPTIDMLCDERVRPGERFAWVWQGKAREYTYTDEDAGNARDLIAKYVVLPDVGGPTRFGGFSFLSYVELVP